MISIVEHIEAARTPASILGETGERLAAEYLTRHGFRLVAANFRAPVGRGLRGGIVLGEIDLIALENEILCFTEVKTRRSDDFASPLTAIDIRKQRRITRTARVFRKTFGATGVRVRFDAVSVVIEGKKAPRIDLVRGFWSEDKFRKRFWSDELQFGL